MAERRPPNPNDCSVTLPVEIDVQVKVRSKCKPWGSSRTRGGMSIEYPLEQENMLTNERFAGGGVKVEQSNQSIGQMPFLHDILKKQQLILKNLASSTLLSMSQKNLLLSPSRGNYHVTETFSKLNDSDDFKDEIIEDDEIKQTDNDEGDTSDNDKHQSENQNKIPNSQKYVSDDEIDLFSEVTRINSDTSFDSDVHDVKQDNKNLKNKERQLKGGKTNFPLKGNFENEDNSLQFDTQGSQMVELFSHRKLKVTKNEQTNNTEGKTKIEMDKDEKSAHKDKNCGR